jgi:hypothetical protein
MKEGKRRERKEIIQKERYVERKEPTWVGEKGKIHHGEEKKTLHRV